MRFVPLCLLLSACFLSPAPEPTAPPRPSAPDPAPGERTITLVYELEIEGVADGSGVVDVWLPAPAETPWQTVTSFVVTGDVEGAVRPLDDRYGNRVWHGVVDNPDGEPLHLTATSVVVRRLRTATPLPGAYSAAERAEGGPFLQAEARVPVAGEPVDRIAADIAPSGGDPSVVARAVYDFVVDTMEYKKTGTGWGNGDTYWACSEKYGNCTDFHALFNSLTRNKGLPSTFSIGFPVPEERPAGVVGGYHCWANVLLPGVGWVGVDASEAKKNPTDRDLLFGTLPPDRVHFSSGRDLDVGQKSGPLNYFVDALVEVDGERWAGWRKTVRYAADSEP